MRAKEERCVVTFPTTAAAMEMERLCKAHGVLGRLIPVPRSITAGCGLCWSAPRTEREKVEQLVMTHYVLIDGIYAVIF